MASLLIRIRPFNYESILSFLYRLSRENFYSSPRYFLGLLNGKYPDMEELLYNNDFIYLIDGQIGYEQRELNKLTISHFLAQYSNNNLILKNILRLMAPKRRHKFCPLCMREKDYHRIYWLLAPYTICHKHKVYMQDKCPKCNTFISFRQLMKGCCICGTRFKDTELWSVERHSHIEMGTFLSNKILLNTININDKEYKEQSVNIFPSYDSLSFIHLLTLFVNVLKYYRTDTFKIRLPDNRLFVNDRTKKLNGYITPYIMTELYVLANKLLSNWPENLWIYLDELKNTYSYETYNKLVSRLKKDLLNYDLIWREISKYLLNTNGC
ncbi:MAG: TniQ family protein [Bacillota bacterium]